MVAPFICTALWPLVKGRRAEGMRIFGMVICSFWQLIFSSNEKATATKEYFFVAVLFSLQTIFQ
jgi:hypothetical protein